MTDDSISSDPTMQAIGKAVSRGREGDVEASRRDLLAIWKTIGAAGDPFHRCTLAHYLADLYENPAEALIWNVRALDAADSLTDRRAQQYHSTLQVAGFFPSLHLNIADDLRRMGAFGAADDHIRRAEQHIPALPDGDYGDTIRQAIIGVRQAIRRSDTASRESAPHARP